MRIKEAAEYLGVSKDTLRKWDREGKLKALRHPINRYRLYREADLDALLADVAKQAESHKDNRGREQS